MTAQDKELAQIHDSIVDDVKNLVDKYVNSELGCSRK